MTDKNGELPKGWKWVKLGEVSNLLSGGTPSRNNSQSFIGVIPWVKTLDLNCSVVHTTEEKISEEAFNEIRGKILPVGTVMVAMYGGVGTIGKSGILGIPATTNQAICSILPNPDLFIPEFLHAWLILIRSEWMLYSGGNRKDPNINKSVVEQMRFPLPPLPEQKRIVAILNEQIAAVEKARADAEAQLQAAKTLPAAYLREVFDSPEAQKWERKKLEEICNISTGTTPATDKLHYYQGNIPFAKTSEIVNNKINRTEICISQQAVNDYSLKIYPIGTVLMAMYGQGKTRGQVGILNIPATTTQNAAAIVPSSNLLSEYLWYWLRGQYEYLRSIGYLGDISHLSLKYVKQIEIPFTTVIEQQNLVKELDQKMISVENLQRSLQDQLDTIKQLPAALLRQAFNGEL